MIEKTLFKNILVFIESHNLHTYLGYLWGFFTFLICSLDTETNQVNYILGGSVLVQGELNDKSVCDISDGVTNPGEMKGVGRCPVAQSDSGGQGGIWMRDLVKVKGQVMMMFGEGTIQLERMGGTVHLSKF